MFLSQRSLEVKVLSHGDRSLFIRFAAGKDIHLERLNDEITRLTDHEKKDPQQLLP
jgi:hypothetical protein